MNELYNDKMERDLVSQVLTSFADDYKVCAAVLEPDSFHDKACAELWAVCRDMDKEGMHISMVNAHARAAALYGEEHAADLMATITSPWHMDVGPVAETIAVLAGKRRYLAVIQDTVSRIQLPGTSLDECTEALRQVANETGQKTVGMATITDVFRQLLLKYQARLNGEEAPAVNTGFHYIDDRGGLKAGNLDVIAGRTSNGKTALAMAIAVNVATRGVPVAIYSLEMTIEELGERVASMVSRISQGELRDMTLDRLGEVQRGMAKAWGAPIHFDRRRTNDLEQVMWSIRNMVRDHGVRVAVVDYLQLLTSKTAKDDRQRVGGAANALKALAVELGITIIALSQLARGNSAGSHEPKMEQLKESGDVENAADNVYMVYRAELYKERYPDEWKEYDTAGTALVINSKARSGQVGSFIAGFDAGCTLYYDNPKLNKYPETQPTSNADYSTAYWNN